MPQRPTADSERRGGGQRVWRKGKEVAGGSGARAARGESARRWRAPSINFHARIIIGKLESWLPDSRFVSPNESERVGAQRRAAAGGSFRLSAASSKSSWLRRAIIIVSLARFPPARPPSRAADPCTPGSRQAKLGTPPRTPGGSSCRRRGAPLCPRAGAVYKQWRRSPPLLAAQICALAASLSPHPLTSDSCRRERGVHPPLGSGRGSPTPAPGWGPGQPFVKPT